MAKHVELVAAAGLAAAVWFGTGLQPRWPVTWVIGAAATVLFLSGHPRRTYWLAFTGWAVGSLNMAAYMSSLMPWPLRVLFIAGPALLFASSTNLAAGFTGRNAALISAPVFAASWVGYEYLLSLLLPHGAFFSLAYTQMDNLAIVRLAEWTGVWGVSFLLLLLPASLACAVWSRSTRPLVWLAGGALLLAPAHREGKVATVRVGLAATDRTIPAFQTRKREEMLAVLDAYVDRVRRAAEGGARVVLLPEKFVGVDPSHETAAIEVLRDAAVKHQVVIIAGLNVLSEPKRNQAWVIQPNGSEVVRYDKRHFLPGWEDGYHKGERPLVLPLPDQGYFGVAICKDMDFPSTVREYAGSPGALMIPAWDFRQDAWLHSRMAMMRGVENGLTVVRVAQEGRLTVSDRTGRVLLDQSSGDGADVVAVASVPLTPGGTFYSRYGDWFGWIALLVLIGARIARWRRKRLSGKHSFDQAGVAG